MNIDDMIVQDTDLNKNSMFNYEEVRYLMIVCAKYHVKKALEEASEKVDYTCFKNEEAIKNGNCGRNWCINICEYKAINKDLILNAYNLDNIK